MWTETVWKCAGGECWEETMTHTEYWIKRSISTDQHHWSAPENVVQVKSTTGNPVVIEKQDGSFIMYYKDQYVWTEQNCWLEGCPQDCQYVCETITHTEYWIYRRTSSDGLIWGTSVKFQQTTLNVRDIAVIQKQDSTYLMCYTDKVSSSYYIRQKTSPDGVTWSAPSNVILVDNQTGNPALLQRDSGVLYLTYRKGSSIYILSNSGSGWSSPVQSTTTAQGDPALLDTDSDILIIYKGTDGYFYRNSSPDGLTWSSPTQMAPQKPLSNPSAMRRTDRMYRVVSQSISSSAVDLVKVLEFSYEGDSHLTWSPDILVRDAQTLQSSMHFEYDSKGRPVVTISKDAQGIQTQKIVYTYNGKDKVIRQDAYAGNSTEISFSTITGYDDHSNIVYTRNPEGAEHFYSYSNTNSQNQFIDSKGVPVTLFTNQFYSNNIPLDCHALLVGEAFINSEKVQEVYYKYDANGNPVEIKTLFPTRDYAVFSGTFDEEPGQTSFTFDLTGLTIADGILIISSVAVPTPETLYEVDSEPGMGWQNTGTWEGKYFKAEYIRCVSTPEPDCYDGYIRIGPFEHYPGSPNYAGYTTWIEDNIQYVKTSYSAIINEYPAQVDYKLNTSSWTNITNNLGSGTTSILISASNFVQGLNTLQFQETNTYFTKFEWTLYIDQGAEPDDYTTSFSYDSYGNIASVTDTIGNTTYYQHDSNHLYLTSITNALNHTISATHNFATGLLTSMTDANGNTSSFEYDILGRVTKKINPDLTEKETVYDDQHNTATVYDELDHYTIRYYDGIGRLTRAEWYLSPAAYLSENFIYNYQNKVIAKTDCAGHIYSYEYDSCGRLTKLLNPDLTFTMMCYDDTAHTVSIIDENQHKKDFHYNWVNQLVWIKDYTNPVDYYLTQYTYDILGHLTSFTDAIGNTISYEYNSLFGLTAVVYPDATTETYSYDAMGNLLQIIDANGTTAFTYDATCQTSTIQYPDQSPIIFEYDENGNRISMIDSEGSSTYVYDNRNRLLSETKTIMGDLYTTAYQYDAASNVTSITYPDQSVITYEYDSLGRIVSIPGYAQFTYNTDSLLASSVYSNGAVTTYEYDSRDRPLNLHTQKNGTGLLLMSYQYDGVGNVQQMEYSRMLPNQQWVQSVETYGYDWLNRLVSAQGDYGLLSYSYDAVGNRLSENNLTYAYNNMNELLSTDGGMTFTYDEMGNIKTKYDGTDTWTFTHDKRNMLTQVEKNQKILDQYAYDGDNKRIRKTVWEESLQEYETKVCVYSGSDILYEKNVGTGQEAIYIYGPPGRIAKEVGGLVDYYHRDTLRSTRLITNESGNPVCEVSYSPFGLPNKTGEDREKCLFNEKEVDSGGLYYYGARYLDPQIGRWIERDPNRGDIRNPESLNRYVYCYNNPLRYIDMDGFAPKARNVTKTTIFWYAISVELAYGAASIIFNWLVIPTILCGIYWKWLYDTLAENFIVDFALMQNGEHVLDIHARGDTTGIDMYIANIVVGEDEGDYKAYVDNESNTEVRVFVTNKGSGTLEMHVGGYEGSYTFIIAKQGRLDIYVDQEGLDLHVKIYPGATVTIFVPMGQTPPNIYGADSYIIVYYYPEDNESESPRNEER